MIKGVESFAAMRAAATGLRVQRARMDIAAENIANASTTETAEGGPYRRRVVDIAAAGPGIQAPKASFASALSLLRSHDGHQTNLRAATSTAPAEEIGVRVAGFGRDESEGPTIYDPSHPSADEAGYVHMPNVDIVMELLDLTGAARAYEANLVAFRAAQAAAQSTLQIGGGS